MNTAYPAADKKSKGFESSKKSVSSESGDTVVMKKDFTIANLSNGDVKLSLICNKTTITLKTSKKTKI